MRKVLIKVGRYIWEFNARATLSMRVVALLPTAGADDLDGCEAAASAVHRSVASGAQTDDVASAKRVEQGLRRLAVSIDKTSPAAGCKTHELLEMLAGYVQAGTMLARRRGKSIPKDSVTNGAIGDDAAKDAMDVDGAASSRKLRSQAPCPPGSAGPSPGLSTDARPGSAPARAASARPIPPRSSACN